jgi:hypothetical protein
MVMVAVAVSGEFIYIKKYFLFFKAAAAVVEDSAADEVCTWTNFLYFWHSIVKFIL